MNFKMGQATREAFGHALAELGEEFRDVVVVDGDVHNSTYTEFFGKKFPDRFFNVGIAESDMIGIAAGLAASGKRAWASSFATFITCNGYDQLRMSVAFPNMDVKIVGTHAGISIGEDGPSQMGIEDVSLTCSLPNFTVVVPADEVSTRKAVRALAAIKTPAYLRAGRPKVPILYEEKDNFRLGKANQLRDGKDVTIIANGLMVSAALDAAEQLAAAGTQARCSICTRSSRSTMRPFWPPPVTPGGTLSSRKKTCCTAAQAAPWRCRPPGKSRYRCASLV